jgi:multiple sugar transport system permease protein
MSKMKDIYNQPKDSSYAMQRFIKSSLVFVGLVLLTLICLIPIYLVAVNATRTHGASLQTPISFIPGGALLDNLEIARNKFQFKAEVGFLNSFIISGSVTILTMFFSCLTAYGICVYNFKIKDAAFTFILAVMMVPTQVMGVGFVRFMGDFFGMNLVGSYTPLIVPAIASPAVVFFMCQNMKATFPFDIIEAARIDGCAEFRTFLTIGLPMLKPAIAVQSIFAFVASWNNYYTPSLILSFTGVGRDKRTLPMLIAMVTTNDKVQDNGARSAVTAISIVPMIIAYVIFSRFIIEGVAAGGVKE